MAQVANQISKNLFKLSTNSVKTLIEWSNKEPIHLEYLSKLNEFYNLPENAVNYTREKLSVGLEFMALIWKIWYALFDKLYLVYDDVAMHIGALSPNNNT